MSQSELSFSAPTTNVDGSAITEALSYIAFIDTVNPPVKSYAVPAADVAAAVSGVITTKFTELGFTPVNGTTYYVDVEATDQNGASAPTTVLSFVYQGPLPGAPTGLKVS